MLRLIVLAVIALFSATFARSCCVLTVQVKNHLKYKRRAGRRTHCDGTICILCLYAGYARATGLRYTQSEIVWTLTPQGQPRTVFCARGRPVRSVSLPLLHVSITRNELVCAVFCVTRYRKHSRWSSALAFFFLIFPDVCRACEDEHSCNHWSTFRAWTIVICIWHLIFAHLHLESTCSIPINRWRMICDAKKPQKYNAREWLLSQLTWNRNSKFHRVRIAYPIQWQSDHMMAPEYITCVAAACNRCYFASETRKIQIKIH